MPVRNIFFGGLILIIAGFIAYLQATGRYGLTPLLAAFSFFVLGFVHAVFTNQRASQKQNDAVFLFTSCCFFLAVYLINSRMGNPSLLAAAVNTSCLLLPFILVKSWYSYQQAFQPVEISPWLLPVPYSRSNAISLHLNSVPFTFRMASAPGSAVQDYPVTAPGIKTLGMVFSELVYENKSAGEQADFSDIQSNPYGWIFYVRELGGLSTRQLDANLSLLDNHLKTNAIVTAQRQ